MKSISVSSVAKAIFPKLGLSQKAVNAGVFAGEWTGRGPVLEKRSPIDGSLLGRVAQATPADYEQAITAAIPVRGEWRLGSSTESPDA